jgi:hypothetical protein
LPTAGSFAVVFGAAGVVELDEFAGGVALEVVVVAELVGCVVVEVLVPLFVDDVELGVGADVFAVVGVLVDGWFVAVALVAAVGAF